MIVLRRIVPRDVNIVKTYIFLKLLIDFALPSFGGIFDVAF